MSTFNSYRHPKARKEHRCAYCGWHIPVGEQHVQFVGEYEGEFQNWRMHNECHVDHDASGEETFFMGESDPPKIIKELYTK